MPKRLEITDEIKARIYAAAGSEIDVSKVVVFECIAANSHPLDKRGSIYHKGVISPELLAEMAGIPAKGGVPLHNMHLQGMEHPIGKTFFAQAMSDERGGTELRSQFYLPITEVDLISKLDTGVIDEVSVGVRSKEILCSACGFNYATADIMAIYNQTCENDHTIGKDGVHVQLKGLDRWLELSLVSLGAGDKPKIVGRTKALLGADNYNQLAASGQVPDATTLFATVKDQTMTNVLDTTKLVADFADATGKLAVANVTLTAAQAQVTDLTARLTASEARVAELTAAQTEPVAKLAKLTGEADATILFLTEQLKAQNVVLGKEVKDEDLPKDLPGLVAALKATSESVHKLIPINGKSKTNDELAAAEAEKRRMEGFSLSATK